MDDQFCRLAGDVTTAPQLAIPRAVAVFHAVTSHRDYQIIELRCIKTSEDVELECIIVDVECDGVPSQNEPGIQYRERLALCIPVDPKAEIEVLALRMSFPLGLMHQSRRDLSSASRLCLYFEPLSSILRNWTPERFLRRIQWWLEATSRDDLHPADQPVEQLFFVTRYELILPWNFDTLRNQAGQRLTIRKGQERPDKGQSFFLTPATAEDPRKFDVTPMEFTLSAIKHGQVEQDPSTLGELVDLLSGRGADLFSELKIRAQERMVSDGMPSSMDNEFSVVMLHMPVTRTLSDGPEKYFRRAFLLKAGGLRLGESLGALFQLDGKYFDAIGVTAEPGTKWRDEPIFAMEVQRFCDSATAREQSGINSEGPNGLLIGAGSLGSAMLNLWGRSGWGRWTVIDKDHIKPHNLVRHTAFAECVGSSKAEVVAQLNDAVTNGASRVIPICADVLDQVGSEVEIALNAAELVVDASTTLEYPRRISNQNGIGRHVTVFVTPDGNSSVLMAEDRKRSIRLRTLEAQYYRAMIQCEWGSNHLTGNNGTFWSGASCRDISMVLPYSRILAHAATLAEQVQSVSEEDEAVLRIWSRAPGVGSVVAHSIAVHQEQKLTFDNLDLFIDAGIKQKLRDMRKAYAPLETGGVLIGYYDFLENMVVVVDAMPAPPDSRSTASSFERGIEGVPEFISDVSGRTADVVHYIGEWHSHPPGHSAAPSSDDIIQLAGLSEGMALDGLPAVSLIVGEYDIQILTGRKST